VAERKGQEGHVVVDADGEVVLGLVGREVVVDGLCHARGEILRAEAVTSADDGPVVAPVLEYRADVEVERFAEGAVLLRPVEDGDLLDRVGYGLQEVLGRERAVEADDHQSDLLAARVQVVDRLHGGLRAGAHHDDDAVRVGRAVVVEEVVAASGQLEDLLHLLLDYSGDLHEELVGGLVDLEVYVRVLGGSAEVRMLGIERPVAVPLDHVPVHERGHLVVLDDLDLLDLVGRTEPVEERYERERRAYR